MEHMKHQKILAWDDLQATRAAYADAGLKVVQCHGCFDIVHPGHIRYLRFAKAQGDVLIVSITSDAFVTKGYDRPFIHEEMRAENLAVFEFVDHVIIDPHSTALEVLDAVRPDVYVKGKEYESNQDVRFLKEQSLVESHGGRVVFSSGDVVFSSTHLLNFLRHDEELIDEKRRFFCKTHGITLDVCHAALSRLRDVPFLVFGDAIIDQYVRCEDASLASEHPVLSVTPTEAIEYVGGAALIAAQLAALGSRSTLLTVYDDPINGPRFQSGCTELGFELCVVGTDPRPVFVKTRYLVENQKVFKVNSGSPMPLSSVGSRDVIRAIREKWPTQTHRLVTDFGYGLFTHSLIDTFSELGAQGEGYSVDISRGGASHLLKLENATFAAPTEDELRLAFGDYESGLSNLASRYLKATNTSAIVITMGSKGALLMSPIEGASNLKAEYLPAFSRNPVDVVGAGDVFFAVFSACAATGSPRTVALFLASVIAASHIQRMGNLPTSLEALLQALDYTFGRGK
ncbi:MAG: PfkB family carbohydrate kinase [bacterium]